jgi:hypothetical protein
MRAALLCLLLPCAALAEPDGIYGYSGQISSTCNNCHSGGTAPTVTLSGPSTLMAGASGTYTLTISGGAGVVGGLDVSTVSDAMLIPGNGMQGIGSEVTHTSPKSFSGGTVSFSFTVSAPSASGTVKLYGAGLSANGNGHNSGDRAGTTTFSITVTGGAPPPVDAGSPPPPPEDAGSPPPPPPPPPEDAGAPPPPPPPVDAGAPVVVDAGAPPAGLPSTPSEPQALAGEEYIGGCSETGALPQALLLAAVAAFVVLRRRMR